MGDSPPNSTLVFDEIKKARHSADSSKIQKKMKMFDPLRKAEIDKTEFRALESIEKISRMVDELQELVETQQIQDYNLKNNVTELFEVLHPGYKRDEKKDVARLLRKRIIRYLRMLLRSQTDCHTLTVSRPTKKNFHNYIELQLLKMLESPHAAGFRKMGHDTGLVDVERDLPPVHMTPPEKKLSQERHAATISVTEIAQLLQQINDKIMGMTTKNLKLVKLVVMQNYEGLIERYLESKKSRKTNTEFSQLDEKLQEEQRKSLRRLFQGVQDGITAVYKVKMEMKSRRALPGFKSQEIEDIHVPEGGNDEDLSDEAPMLRNQNEQAEESSNDDIALRQLPMAPGSSEAQAQIQISLHVPNSSLGQYLNKIDQSLNETPRRQLEKSGNGVISEEKVTWLQVPEARIVSLEDEENEEQGTQEEEEPSQRIAQEEDSNQEPAERMALYEAESAEWPNEAVAQRIEQQSAEEDEQDENPVPRMEAESAENQEAEENEEPVQRMAQENAEDENWEENEPAPRIDLESAENEFDEEPEERMAWDSAELEDEPLERFANEDMLFDVSNEDFDEQDVNNEVDLETRILEDARDEGNVEKQQEAENVSQRFLDADAVQEVVSEENDKPTQQMSSIVDLVDTPSLRGPWFQQESQDEHRSQNVEPINNDVFQRTAQAEDDEGKFAQFPMWENGEHLEDDSFPDGVKARIQYNSRRQRVGKLRPPKQTSMFANARKAAHSHRSPNDLDLADILEKFQEQLKKHTQTDDWQSEEGRVHKKHPHHRQPSHHVKHHTTWGSDEGHYVSQHHHKKSSDEDTEHYQDNVKHHSKKSKHKKHHHKNTEYEFMFEQPYNFFSPMKQQENKDHLTDLFAFDKLDKREKSRNDPEFDLHTNQETFGNMDDDSGEAVFREQMERSGSKHDIQFTPKNSGIQSMDPKLQHQVVKNYVTNNAPEVIQRNFFDKLFRRRYKDTTPSPDRRESKRLWFSRG